MTTKNLVELGSSIGDAATRTEALNIYTEKEAQLKKELGNNIVALNLAASAAADSLRAIAGFKEGTLFADEYKQIQNKAREDRIRSKTNKPSDIFGAFSDEMTYGVQDAFRDLNNTAADTARTMKSEFNNAFQSVIDGTQNVGDAFRTMALNISRRMQQLALEMTTNLAFNSLFSSIGGLPSAFKNPLGRSKGGYIQGFSEGGKVLGGSGTKDDVPAMLSNGEYVIKKSSVNKYGTKFLNQLNGGGVVKKADGGNVSDELIAEYLRNSNKTPASETDPGRVVDAATRDLFAQSINAMLDNKDVSYNQTFSKLLSSNNPSGGEFKSSLGAFYTYNDPNYPTAGEYLIDPLLSQLALTDPNDPQNRVNDQNRRKLFDYLVGGMDLYEQNKQSILDTIQRNKEENARINQLNQQQQDAYNNQLKMGTYGTLAMVGLGFGASALSNYGAPALKSLFGGSSKTKVGGQQATAVGDFGKGYGYKYATYVKNGGFIGYANGGYSNRDDVPAMLMGGEYVMKKDSVNTYGRGFFDKLNSGKIKKFADGGMVSDNLTDINNKKTSENNLENNINITVNVNGSDSNVQMNSENSAMSSAEGQAKAIKFADQLKAEIIKVIVQQQRPGGLLTKSK